MGNSVSSAAICCSDSDGPGAARKIEFPPERKGPLSARKRTDLPPGQVNNASPRKNERFLKFAMGNNDITDSNGNGEESPAQPSKASKGLKHPKNGTSYDLSSSNRKQPWRLTPVEESVGVGAHFEATQSGAIRVRGLAKGGPAELSGLFSVGDELIEVDGIKTFGRPLSELGHFVLGKPGSQVRMVLISTKTNEKYEACILRGKAADAVTKLCMEPPVGEYLDALRL